MAERDPFGRLPDENPLAGLGSLSDGIESYEPPQPVVSARPAGDGRGDGGKAGASPHDEPGERRRRPRRPGAGQPGSPEATLRDLLVSVQTMKSAGATPPVARDVGRIVKTVIVLAIVVAFVASIGGLLSGSAVVDGVSDLPDRVGLPAEGGSGGAPAAEPVGLGEGSMLLRRNLEPALRSMRTRGLGRLKSLSIRPERVDAQLLTNDGRLRSVQQRFDGKLTSLSVSDAGSAGLKTIPFARADPSVPSRLARSAAERVGRAVSDVDYVVFIDIAPESVWTIVMKRGGQFIADARGRITRRIG
jgi:hypothetical protein